jgi:flagellar secretion chaperone FliS
MTYSKKNGLARYAQVAGTTEVAYASPHRLVQMLMEAALDKIAVASGQASRREFEAKGRSINWAISIINGLRGSLNLEGGGDIAHNLDDLYDYMVRRLLDANAASDPAILHEVSGLLGEVKSGWDAIPPDLHHGPGVRQAAAG